MPPMITALYAALCAFLLLFLALRVMLYRNQHKIGVGDGDDRILRRRIRVHGNAAEFVPLALLLLLLNELAGASPVWLHGWGSALLVVRVLHAWGLTHSGGYSFGRGTGFIGTFVVIIAMAVALLARWFGL